MKSFVDHPKELKATKMLRMFISRFRKVIVVHERGLETMCQQFVGNDQVWCKIGPLFADFLCQPS